jgi:hypothetical protein
MAMPTICTPRTSRLRPARCRAAAMLAAAEAADLLVGAEVGVVFLCTGDAVDVHIVNLSAARTGEIHLRAPAACSRKTAVRSVDQPPRPTER